MNEQQILEINLMFNQRDINDHWPEIYEQFQAQELGFA